MIKTSKRYVPKSLNHALREYLIFQNVIFHPGNSEEKGDFDIKFLLLALLIGQFAAELCSIK